MITSSNIISRQNTILDKTCSSVL